MTTTRVPGRPRSIPTEHFDTVLKLYADGVGARSVAAVRCGLRTQIQASGAGSACPGAPQAAPGPFLPGSGRPCAVTREAAGRSGHRSRCGRWLYASANRRRSAAFRGLAEQIGHSY